MIIEFLRGLKSRLRGEVKSEDDGSRHILWVTTFDGEGYSSSHYGWSTNMSFTYEEAIKEKERLKDRYHEIEIVKYSDFAIPNKEAE